jgi:dTDP-glucose pyrophosphorylase
MHSALKRMVNRGSNRKDKEAIVLAAGKGTRLLPLTLAMPKEMIRVGTKPVIEHAIEVLKAGGIKEILVIVGRKKEAIIYYLGSGERVNLKIYYRIQEEPKGSAHAVYQGKILLGQTVLLSSMAITTSSLTTR